LDSTAQKYDVIVIGGGHAGCEAALACSRLGHRTLLTTMNLDSVARMSCNPAIGGLGKGHLVKEIDALGGEMAKITDETGIQFRRLNTKKGPAVRSSRAQVDLQLYHLRMKRVLEKEENLFLRQVTIEKIFVDDGKVFGVEANTGEKFMSKAVIVTTGTFLNGLVHIGLKNFAAGRLGDPPSKNLSECLRDLGFSLGRLKTGTCPRLHGRSIDFSQLARQCGDDPPRPFSFRSKNIPLQQVPCFITYTNPQTHEIIKSGLDRSPLYCGVIKGVGARYCPSIEDKIVRFPEKCEHQIFLEPTGLDTIEIYPNGLATSLPMDIQIKMIRSIPGLEHAEIIRPGYGIEYDFADPIQLKPSLETKRVKNLFFAGQINGTSGYEEAAAQGLIAGINASQNIKGENPLLLGREEAYIGVLIDDLVTKGTQEPYRMFTSRAEYRLLLREDNADLRLKEKGRAIGLISGGDYQKFVKKKEAIESEMARIKKFLIHPTPSINDRMCSMGSSPLRNPAFLAEILRRPEISFHDLKFFDSISALMDEDVAEQVEIQIKYEGYIQRQTSQVAKLAKMEEIRIPQGVDYESIPGLTKEVREKLGKVGPISLGQASRISGITPAAISVLSIFLKRFSAAGSS
jgi:tRNA uridine 5-carboxymethylaminomethyl modification enzyme